MSRTAVQYSYADLVSMKPVPVDFSDAAGDFSVDLAPVLGTIPLDELPGPDAPLESALRLLTRLESVGALDITVEVDYVNLSDGAYPGYLEARQAAAGMDAAIAAAARPALLELNARHEAERRARLGEKTAAARRATRLFTASDYDKVRIEDFCRHYLKRHAPSWRMERATPFEVAQLVLLDFEGRRPDSAFYDLAGGDDLVRAALELSCPPGKGTSCLVEAYRPGSVCLSLLDDGRTVCSVGSMGVSEARVLKDLVDRESFSTGGLPHVLTDLARLESEALPMCCIRQAALVHACKDTAAFCAPYIKRLNAYNRAWVDGEIGDDAYYGAVDGCYKEIKKRLSEPGSKTSVLFEDVVDAACDDFHETYRRQAEAGRLCEEGYITEKELEGFMQPKAQGRRAGLEDVASADVGASAACGKGGQSLSPSRPAADGRSD